MAARTPEHESDPCLLRDARDRLDRLRSLTPGAGEHAADLRAFYDGLAGWLDEVRTEVAGLTEVFESVSPDQAARGAAERLDRLHRATGRAQILARRLDAAPPAPAPGAGWSADELRQSVASLRERLRREREAKSREESHRRAAFVESLRGDVLRLRGADPEAGDPPAEPTLEAPDPTTEADGLVDPASAKEPAADSEPTVGGDEAPEARDDSTEDAEPAIPVDLAADADEGDEPAPAAPATQSGAPAPAPSLPSASVIRFRRTDLA